ncbi:hypothetical protein FOXB_00547 [Fusarium oxysporum f. sp. conglutinans Fo5176]|uniref:EthD domain-containing protein n=1 Tax=Fusarium oxysporum (strain Fo5176) TaxID=660025 RepID=F9F2C3_FUSOF|nr:hypothetical protein FOXB_00547 [Fusarium oxysporum f. sp. conglutinans Fo5176]
MPSKPLMKQIAAGRRKPNLTRKEFLDHRFRIHGQIADAPEDKDLKPQWTALCRFETSISLMAWEKPVEVPTRLASERSNVPLNKDDAIVAMYFISTPDDAREGQQLETTLTPLLIKALEEYSQDEGFQTNSLNPEDKGDFRIFQQFTKFV